MSEGLVKEHREGHSPAGAGGCSEASRDVVMVTRTSPAPTERSPC